MMATKARRAHRLYQPQETSAVLSIVAIKRLQCLIQATSENNGIVGRSKRMSTATSGRFAELGIRTSASERATQSSLTLWKHQKKKKKLCSEETVVGWMECRRRPLGGWTDRGVVVLAVM